MDILIHKLLVTVQMITKILLNFFKIVVLITLRKSLQILENCKVYLRIYLKTNDLEYFKKF